MPGFGFSQDTGQSLDGWEHVKQSVYKILTTSIGSRVMRREFGSELPDLIDNPITPRVILALFAASANALTLWEPRFQLTNAEIIKVEETGRIDLSLTGIYYPRGHLGDFTPEGGQREFFVEFAGALL